MTFCPFCGVRADIDLRQIHFRDLGEDAAVSCPECSIPVHVFELGSEPGLRVERCLTCHGILFNPGELEAMLETQTHPLVWLDSVQLNQIAGDFGHQREIAYRPCPVCRERMGHLNFGGRSGVILDRCATHGVWVQGGQLRRLTEWWRAGGKLIYQNHEAKRVRNKYAAMESARQPKMHGTTESPRPEPTGPWGFPVDPVLDWPSFTELLDCLVSLGSD